MKQIVICVALSIGLLIPSVANGAETSGILPSDPNTLTQYHMDKYGDSFEISWTTNFKRTTTVPGATWVPILGDT